VATVLRKELTSQTRLAPLILRIVLAAIFIFHGAEKFTSRGGATDWATNLWLQRARPPMAAEDALRQFKDKEGEKGTINKVDEAKATLARAYEADKEKKEPPKEAMDALDAYKKTKEGGELTINKADQAKATLDEAYGNANPTLPEILSQPSGIQLAIAVAELVCGVALLLGLLTRLAAVLMIVVQAGAIWFLVSTMRGGVAPTEGGGFEFEYNIVLIAVCLVVALRGGGGVAIDHYLFRRRHKATTTTPSATPAPTGAPHISPAAPAAAGTAAKEG
jgi:uncharacterized membrane protein YphA (DoxX/SURF4 family)